jgi:hypothetical protein
MTDYTDIALSALLPGEPWTAGKALAVYENPIAIAEGAVGAPRIDFAAMNEWFSTAGAIGTYVFARSTTVTNVAFGATRAGSALVPTGAITGFLSLISGPNGPLRMLASGSALSGSWQCMGYYDHTLVNSSDDPAQDVDVFGATLWMRVS